MDIANNILPLFFIFGMGFASKKLGFLTKENADLFLKLFFYLVLPAVVLLSISRVPLTLELISLPLLAIGMFLLSFTCATVTCRFFRLKPASLGVFLIGSIILNGSFVYPFVYVMYGEKGMAIAYLFDFGNAIIAFSFAYYLACRYGSSGKTQTNLYKKFLLSPPLLALSVAVMINLSGLKIPSAGQELLKIMGGMTTPLIMLSLGIYFSPRIVKPGPLLTVILIRMLGGLIFGYLLVAVFGLSGVNKTITLIMAVSPSAMNTLIYASMEGLDKEFAASIISYTTAISMILISVLIFILH